MPAALVISALMPALVMPLLMLGGVYLCFEGAEKVLHALAPHADAQVEADFDTADPAHLEEQKVAGAIKTDFILSAEIMTLALGSLPDSARWVEAVTLALVAIMITVLVYGSVALIVKMDDIGLYVARTASWRGTRALGRGLVLAMPVFLSFLSTLGTAAMLWVGGSMLVHGAEVFGFGAPAHAFEHGAEIVAHAVPLASGLVTWAVKATLDGAVGLVAGMAIIPLATRVIGPLFARISKT